MIVEGTLATGRAVAHDHGRDVVARAARRRLLHGSPLAERRVDVAGIDTAVLEGGIGSPLVLLHGGIACGGACWGPVVRRLAERHHLLIPDVPGLGESAPVTPLDASTFAEWLEELLKIACDRDPIVVAHSLVGSLTARFASRHGDLLRGLVIYSSPAIGPFRPPPGLILASMRFDLKPSMANLQRLQRWPFLDPARLRSNPKWLDGFNTYMLDRGSRSHVKRTMRQLFRAGTKEAPQADLQGIAVPTHLIWGRHDRMTPLSLGEGASARFGWPLHVVEDAGHVPHIEQPERFGMRLDAALRSIETSAHDTQMKGNAT